MVYDEVRAFLDGAREAYLKCADIRERTRRLESAAERVTAQLNGYVGGGGADREALLAALADAHGRLLRDMAEEEQRQQEIAAFIDRVPTTASGRAILRRRYLHYESWKSVRKWMAVHGTSLSQQSMYRIHGEALRAARILWKKEHEGDDKHE